LPKATKAGTSRAVIAADWQFISDVSGDYERNPMNDVQIFTTPILDGIKIRQYKRIVIVRNVRAVNVIRDIFTSFRDIFGGRSASYQEVMRMMQDDVIAEARNEAARLGANAIVGFSLDYDNIGSKNKSLLMASAKGTAVVID
jgi:uncharacterized protein YbjQ (UPF0145 family)